jgi:hypothetical protein
VLPFKETYYTDPSTPVAAADQNGSVAAPFVTVQAALDAGALAGLSSLTVITTAVNYPEPTIIGPAGLSIALAPAGFTQIVNGMQLPGGAGLFINGSAALGGLTLGDGSSLTVNGAATISGLTLGNGCAVRADGNCILSGVVFGDKCSIEMFGLSTGDFTSAGTMGGVSMGSTIKSDASQSFGSFCTGFACPGHAATLCGMSIETGLTAKVASISNSTVNNGDIATSDKLLCANDQFAATVPSTITLGAGGAIFQDCEFPAGANLTLDNTAGVAEFDLYSWQRFRDAGCVLVSSANVAIEGQGYKNSVSLVIPGLAPGGTFTGAYPVIGARPGDPIVLNALFGTDVFVAGLNCTAADTVTVQFRSLAGTAGETVTGDFAALL